MCIERESRRLQSMYNKLVVREEYKLQILYVSVCIYNLFISFVSVNHKSMRAPMVWWLGNLNRLRNLL